MAVVMRTGWEDQLLFHRLAQRIGPSLVGAAKRHVRVRTGELRDSIGWEVRGQEMRMGSNVGHALYNELGTSRMSAQPYLRPALDVLRDVL